MNDERNIATIHYIMHIFKSRNPLWLLIDISLAIWMWRAGTIGAALFFTFDSAVQLTYTFLPDMVDSWDKNKKYRVFYTLFLLAGVFFFFRYFVAKRWI